MNDCTNRVQSVTSAVLQANGVIKNIFYKYVCEYVHVTILVSIQSVQPITAMHGTGL